MGMCRLDMLGEGGPVPKSCPRCGLGPCIKPPPSAIQPPGSSFVANGGFSAGSGGTGGVSVGSGGGTGGVSSMVAAGVMGGSIGSVPASLPGMSLEEQAARFLFGVMEDIAQVDNLVPDSPIANGAYRDMVREMLGKRFEVGDVLRDGSVQLKAPKPKD